MKSMRSILGPGLPICAALLTLLLTGCGGGGGGEGADAGKFDRLGVVDSTTAPQIVSGIGNIVDGAGAAVNPVGLQVASGIYCPRSLIQHGVDTVFSSGQGSKALSDSGGGPKVILGSDSETELCSSGGWVTITVEWDGPQNPDDCSQARNPDVEYDLFDCQEDVDTLNGKMSMMWSGDLCSETPGAFEIDLNNLRYENSAEGLNLLNDYTMDFRGVEYDAFDYIIAMTVTMDGSVEGDFEGSSMDVSFNNWTMVCDGIEYNEYDEIAEMTFTLNGGLSGTVDGDSVNEQCRDLNLSWYETFQDSTFGIMYTIDGDYAGRCLDGGVTIETIEPVFVPEDGTCPKSGTLYIYGVGDATVVFNSDASVSITSDGQTLDYDSCEDLPPCM